MRSAESDPSPVGMEDDLEIPLVDDHLMMEPAEDDQIVLIGPTTLGPRLQMVDL